MRLTASIIALLHKGLAQLNDFVVIIFWIPTPFFWFSRCPV